MRDSDNTDFQLENK